MKTENLSLQKGQGYFIYTRRYFYFKEKKMIALSYD